MDKTKRKTKLFSVSFREEDLPELQKHLDNIKAETGMSMSRNELIRRSVLAHIRFTAQPESDYREIFKHVNWGFVDG